MLLLHSLETCQSGRTSKPGKFVYGQPYRGFESLSLRTNVYYTNTVKLLLQHYESRIGLISPQLPYL